MESESRTDSMAGTLRVAFQGERGAYSEQAAFELLGRTGISCVPFLSFDDAFAAVMSGETDMYLAPIENSLGGAVHANYDLQFQHNLFVIAEYELRVRHSLLALPGTKKEDVKKVVSHPQALAQCDGYIKKFGVAREVGYDTAGSAKMISEEKLEGVAAICSEIAADHYGMEVLERGIEDDDTNWTRFILLRREPVRVPPGMPCKTSIVFTLEDSAGALFRALGCFSMRDIDLVKVESRPCKPHVIAKLERLSYSISGGMQSTGLPSRPPEQRHTEQGRPQPAFRYLFYVDFLGSIEDAKVINAFRNLQELTTFFRMLGCYPRGGTLVGLENLGAGTMLPTMMRMSAQASTGPKPRVGVIGFGSFGQFLARRLVLWYDVYATNRSDESAAANAMGVLWCSSVEMLLEQRLDIVILAVSILSFETVLRRLAQGLKERGLDAGAGTLLVVDVLSVKVHAKTSMLAILPDSCDILCTHPMFGPESGKHGWTGLPFVFERVRLFNAKRCEEHLQWWRDQNVRMTDMTCELHDDLAAGSQFVTHFTGRMLNELAMRSTPINTKGFEALLQLVDGTCKDSFDLFFALYKFNPHSEEQLSAMEEAMRSVVQQLRENMSRQVTPREIVGAEESGGR